MADLNVFTYQDLEVRTVTVGGEPWFVAADVARLLGYSSTSAMTRSLEDDEKGVHSLHTPGGDQDFTVVSESGLYSAIFRSRVVGAHQFKRWVTREVLPEIRRTGSYGAAPALSDEEIVHQALQITAKRVEALEAKVAEDAPKVDYHERFVSPPDDAVTVEFFAAQFGVTEPHVRTLMKERGVAVRREIGKRWSKSKGRMEPEYEWRPAAGPALEWFELRPQHNAPRHHNGQVRQTMYVRQFYADQLAQKLGLATPTLTEEDQS